MTFGQRRGSDDLMAFQISESQAASSSSVQAITRNDIQEARDNSSNADPIFGPAVTTADAIEIASTAMIQSDTISSTFPAA